MLIAAVDGRVVGTFANYYREPREPTSRDLEVISMVARTTAIAIECHRNELARERAEEQPHLLLLERYHRVKNAFALLDFTVGDGCRLGDGRPQYAKAMRAALGSAHALIQPSLSGSPDAVADIPLLAYRWGPDSPLESSEDDHLTLICDLVFLC